MIILTKVLQFIFALSILIFVHELGHFAAAKLFKVRVEKFYLFFDWGFALFRMKRVDGKLRCRFFAKPVKEWDSSDSTEYGIGWFPLGGYNKIAGMIDESMDKEQMKQPPQPWEFRTKPAWQRFIIMVAGVFMNVVLAVVIYIGLLSNYGEQYLPTSEVNKYGIVADSLAQEFGLRDGDKILSINGKEVNDFYRITTEMILEDAKTIEVERDGKVVVIELPKDATTRLLSAQDVNFISYRTPFLVADFSEGSVAKAAGMEVGDVIIGINDTPTPYYQTFVSEIKSYKDQDIQIHVARDFDTIAVAMHLPETGIIGVYLAPLSEYFTLETKEYTFWQAIPRGFSKTFTEIGDYWKQLKLIFNPSTKAYESVGGFISIGKIFPETWEWSMFWRLTAFLSIALAVMNILPIPALDGGHILFLLFEIITRRKPSDKFMEIAEYIGLFLVLALVLFANGNDIIKLFK